MILTDCKQLENVMVKCTSPGNLLIGGIFHQFNFLVILFFCCSKPWQLIAVGNALDSSDGMRWGILP